MLNIHGEQKTTTPEATQLAVEGEKAPARVPPAASRQGWPGRLWRAVKRYPIPFGAVTLMLASLVLWLARPGTIGSLTLLAVGPVGGIPPFLGTLRRLLCQGIWGCLLSLTMFAVTIIPGREP